MYRNRLFNNGQNGEEFMIKFMFIFMLTLTLFSCSRKSDLAQLTEQVLDEDQSVRIEITPGTKVK